MKPRHVAIIAHPGKAHTFPSLGLCPELIRRGYRVTFVTDEANQLLVRQAGAEPLIFTPVEFKSTEDLSDIHTWHATDPRWWNMYGSSVYPWLLANARVVLQRSGSFYSDNRPDVFLYDSIAYAGRILAGLSGVPAIQTSPHFAPPRRGLYWHEGVGCNPQPLSNFAPSLDDFLGSHGIETKDNLWHVEDHNIYYIPKEFQYDAQSFDSRYCFSGACLDRPLQGVWRDNSGGRPIILISDMAGNNDPAYFRLFVDALRGLKCHVILTVSHEFPISSLEPLPPGFEVNCHASQLDILPQAALSICRGGNGSVLEAVYHGVPLLVIPIHPYHEETGYRVAHLGVGIHLPKQLATIESIRHSVETLLHDPERQTRVEQMKRTFRGSGGAMAAADSIERFLR
jgi:MGT family glycosyltransferase